MEDKGPICPRVKLELRSFKNIMPTKVVEVKARINASGAKVS